MKLNDQSKIKKAFEEVKITTTSEMILSAYEKQKHINPSALITPRRKPSLWLSLTISLSSVAVLAASAVGISFFINSQSAYTPVIIESHKDQAAFELFTGISLSYGEASPFALSKRMYGESDKGGNNQALTEEHFEEIVKVYDDNYETYSELLAKGADIQYLVTEGSYTMDFGTYQYMMKIENSYTFYYNYNLGAQSGDENDLSGEIHDSESHSYQVDMTVEQNSNTQKQEVQFTLHFGETSSLVIEYAKKPNRFSYQFTYIQDGEETKSIEVEIKRKGQGLRLEVEIINPDSQYSYKVWKIDEAKSRMQYVHDEYSGVIVYSINEGTITYTENKFNFKYSRIFQ